jgi:hypothetical protein
MRKESLLICAPNEGAEMSTIQIKSSSEAVYPNLGGRYFTVELESGRHSAVIIVKPKGGLQVIVQNASHRCWKQAGKGFPSAEAAAANYRTPEIKEMIAAAVRLAAEAASSKEAA